MQVSPSKETVRVGQVTCYFKTHEIAFEDKKIHLPLNEWTLFLLLLQAGGRVIALDRLGFLFLKKKGIFPSYNTIAYLIGALRFRLGTLHPEISNYICTAKWKGFALITVQRKRRHLFSQNHRTVVSTSFKKKYNALYKKHSDRGRRKAA